MELDLILAHFFQFQVLIRVKMPLFLEIIWADLYLANNKNKDNLIFGKGQTKGLDNTSLTAVAEYSISFSR